MNIAYFITGLRLGGAEVITINIANKMADRGCNVIIVYLNGDNQCADRINPQINTIGLNMNKTPYGFIKALFDAKAILKQFNPDVVHGNMIHSNIFVRILRIFSKVPFLISTEHSIDIKSYVRMFLYRVTDFLSDVNTNVSKEATERFIEQKAFSRNKSRVIYNGIDIKNIDNCKAIRNKIREQFGIEQNDFLFINVGRLNLAKDQFNLINAFAETHNSKLIIVGKGELESELQKQINDLSLNDRVILAGAHNNIGDFYNSADCFVLSSAWEGLPMVILEAMAHRLPIITTNVGGAKETIETPEWIVPVKDSNALRLKMECMQHEDKDTLSNIGTLNYERVKKFDLNIICDEWYKLYIQQK